MATGIASIASTARYCPPVEAPLKKAQFCAFCKNHNVEAKKKGHYCPNKECPCLLCELTRKAQRAMRHQQRFWRQQKSKLKDYLNDSNFKIDDGLIDSNGQLRGQVCDKCRNHNHITRKKNHLCPYISCNCNHCSLTTKRRKVMKHQQRIRRSKIIAKMSTEHHQDDGKENVDDAAGSSKTKDSADLKNLSTLMASMGHTEDSREATQSKAARTQVSGNSSPMEVSLSDDSSSLFDYVIESGRESSPPPLIPLPPDNLQDPLHDSSEEDLMPDNDDTLKFVDDTSQPSAGSCSAKRQSGHSYCQAFASRESQVHGSLFSIQRPCQESYRRYATSSAASDVHPGVPSQFKSREVSGRQELWYLTNEEDCCCSEDDGHCSCCEDSDDDCYECNPHGCQHGCDSSCCSHEDPSCSELYYYGC